MPDKGQVTFGAAAELSARIFNGMLEENEADDTVGVTAVQRLIEDPERVSFLLVNLSPNTIFAAFDNQVSSTRGIILSANGGFFSLNAKDDFTLVTRPIFVLSDVAASTLYSFAQRRYKSLPPELQRFPVEALI